MILEEIVRKKVDFWDISFNDPVYYIDLVKPVLYGISIAVTQKGVNHLRSKIKGYTDFSFTDAIKEFKKDYLIFQYIKNDLSAPKTAKSIGLGSSGRIVINNSLAQFGIKLKEIKENSQKYLTEDLDEIYKFITDILDKEIKRYAKIVSPYSFRELINKNSQKMAGELVQIAISIVKEGLFIKSIHEYLDLNYKDAVNEFKRDYFLAQCHLSGKDIKKAAKKAGMTYNCFKTHLATRSISIKALRSNT